MYPTRPWTRVADHVNIGKVKAVLIVAALIDVASQKRKKERRKEGRKEGQVLGTYAIGKDYFAYVISPLLIQWNSIKFESTCDLDDLNPRAM